jgi:hypothetical protein
VVPYSAEYRERQANEQLLTQIASLTGGATLGDPALAFAHDQHATGQPWELWPWLLALAALLFLLDIAVRRLRMAWADVRPFLHAWGRVWQERDTSTSSVGARLATRTRGRRPQDVPLPLLNSAAPADVPRERQAPVQAPSTPSGRLLLAKQRARAARSPDESQEADTRSRPAD